VYPIPFKIDKQKFVYCIHVLKHFSEDVILGINFFPENQKVYWTEKLGSNWKNANFQCPAKLTIKPTSHKMVTLNVITRRNIE
jgi:hypothetical protein